MHRACIFVFGSFFAIGMDFFWLKVGLTLPCQLFDSHGVMGFIIG